MATAAPSTAAPAFSPTPEPTGPPVTISWFCCLGGGDEPSTLKVFDTLVKEFNASQKHIILKFDHVAYEGARDAFATRLGSNNPPDLVGPLGVGGANAFEGQWLELSQYIKNNNIDLSGFDEGVVNLNKSGTGEQFGLPFAIYPSELYYQPDMFDEVGLNPPPATYGVKYQMAGRLDGRLGLRHHPDRRHEAHAGQQQQERRRPGLRRQAHRPVRLRAPA